MQSYSIKLTGLLEYGIKKAEVEINQRNFKTAIVFQYPHLDNLLMFKLKSIFFNHDFGAASFRTQLKRLSCQNYMEAK